MNCPWKAAELNRLKRRLGNKVDAEAASKGKRSPFVDGWGPPPVFRKW